MKIAVLKPIIWNDQGYLQPAGCPTQSGYAHQYGYGHEEWNGNPDWNWRGYRVFHTEPTPRLVSAAQNGDLGMLMFSSHQGTAYALGVASSVFANTDEERTWISDALNLRDQADNVWRTERVRSAFGLNRDEFIEHWETEHLWMLWRCPSEQYHWFEHPIPLDALRITGKERLSSHYTSFTHVAPEIVLDIIDPHMPEGPSAITDWFAFGEFDLPSREAGESFRNGGRTKITRRNGRNAPTDHNFQYWVEGNRSVEPLHHRLQTQFVHHLRMRGIEPLENGAYIDVQYEEDGTTTFAEIKPTENVETCYAIRAAIGQLLESRFHKGQPETKLEIVIGSRPKKKEVAFVESLGLRLIYRTTNGFERAC